MDGIGQSDRLIPSSGTKTGLHNEVSQCFLGIGNLSPKPWFALLLRIYHVEVDMPCSGEQALSTEPCKACALCKPRKGHPFMYWVVRSVEPGHSDQNNYSGNFRGSLVA